MGTVSKTVTAALLLLLAACSGGNEPADNAGDFPGGSAMGYVIGSDFDGDPLTIGKGELKGKGVYVTYFATW